MTRRIPDCPSHEESSETSDSPFSSVFVFGAVMWLHHDTSKGVWANIQIKNRAFNVGPSVGMGFSTSSPSATTGGGQSNSPVCIFDLFIAVLTDFTLNAISQIPSSFLSKCFFPFLSQSAWKRDLRFSPIPIR
jgi:hypothetical protein